MLLGLLFLAAACKSAPAPDDAGPEILTPLTVPDAGDTVLEDANAPPLEIPELTGALPEVPEITADLPEEFLQEGDGGDAAALEEPPSLDLPETAVPPPSPNDNAPAIAALPDVPAPAIQETAAVPPVLPRQEPPVPKPAEPPKAPPPGTSAESKGRGSPPEPPSFLRIPEPVTPPPVREVMPITPLPELPARTPPAAVDENVVFSRTVRATVGQLVEIPFRGTGWVYLGELGSRRGLSYDSRRLDQEGQSFIFRAEAVGTYALKFYKQDFIRDYILNDYVQVIVGEAPDSSGIGWFNPPIDRGRVVAEPRWPTIESGPTGTAPALPETPVAETPQAVPQTQQPAVQTPPAAAVPSPLAAPAQPPAPTRPVVSDDGIAPVPQATASGSPAQSLPPDSSPADYVTRAKQEYDAGRVGSALSVLDQLRQQYTSLTDEALWLYGQLLEANSPGRDIRLALEYYRRLIREYPQSPRVPEAQQRISYLERYYFNLR
ncbi:conserved hypothetical protein [Leadbettera azotonutricia ZAS-9]|uniref:Outer membrane lipoprotein BamD-like domain-containing protein n=2 Tax=Leadbettera azotonutricia TaxID=150829 RepID=F5YDS3_LEAAZ|nr:conserved hypothetical protein [Leadbettera azotonutricia ZAS-9]